MSEAKRKADSDNPDSDDDEHQRLLTAAQVKRRYGGVSDMWIWRRLHDDDSSFARPIDLGGRRRFWRLSELAAWERMFQAGATRDRNAA